MKISDAKESNSRYSKLAMFHFLLSSLHFEMHGIICELRVAERIKKKTKLYKNDKVASTSCEVTAQEVGAAIKAVPGTFLVTKQQQIHRPQGGKNQSYHTHGYIRSPPFLFSKKSSLFILPLQVSLDSLSDPFLIYSRVWL